MKVEIVRPLEATVWNSCKVTSATFYCSLLVTRTTQNQGHGEVYSLRWEMQPHHTAKGHAYKKGRNLWLFVAVYHTFRTYVSESVKWSQQLSNRLGSSGFSSGPHFPHPVIFFSIRLCPMFFVPFVCDFFLKLSQLGRPTFSVKCQVVNISVFMGYMAFVITTQLCIVA